MLTSRVTMDNLTTRPTGSGMRDRCVMFITAVGDCGPRRSASHFLEILMSSSNTQAPAGVQLLGAVTPAFAEILTPDALAFVAKLQREFGGRRDRMFEAPAGTSGGARSRRVARFFAGNETHPRRRLDLRADSGRSARSPRRDHRADRSQDGDQRAQLRRENVHGGFRGREFADVGKHDRGPDQSARCDPAHDQLHQPGRERIPAEASKLAVLARQAARLASGREAHARGWPAGRRRACSISVSTFSTTPRS